MNRKAYFGDIVFIGVLLLVVALCGTFVFYLLDTIQAKMETVSLINGTSFGHTALASMATVASKIDYIFVAFLLASTIGVLIVSYLIPLNFIFAGVYFIVVIVATALSAIISNVFQMVLSSSSLSYISAEIPITSYVLGHLPIFLGSIGFMGLIAMFAKGAISQ